jgi:hypothetical protein
MRGDFGQGWSRQREESAAAHRSEFRVGGVAVEIAGQCHRDVTLLPSLEPFRVQTQVSDINIRVEWADRLGSANGRKLFDSGSVWRLYEDEAGFRFDFRTPALGERPYKRLLVDERFRRAILQMNGECFAAASFSAIPLDYPLDELLIMHRLAQEKAIELHACGIVRADGTGNLLVGHSGAGKSTITRLWTAHEDVEVLSDDRIIVRRDLLDNLAGIRMYGTPWHGEAMYASPGSAPLARIFILHHGHGNVLTRLSPSRAVAELFARSFVPFHRYEYVDSALEFLQEVVDAVPCYRYAFEPNESAVERILELHD